MRVGKKNFPYPVINRDLSYSTFINSNFQLADDLEIIRKENILIIKNVYYKINDSYIEELIEKKLIKVYCVVECSHTVYRKEFIIGNQPTDVEVDINNLRNAVVISAFGVAAENFEGYSTKSFDKHYLDFKFSIQKNNILLIDDGFSIKVEFDEAEDDKISSIFNVIKVKRQTKTIDILGHSTKIFIYLPEEQFNIYENLSRSNLTHPIFFSILLIPALYKELSNLQLKSRKDETNFESIDDIIREFKWFRSVANRYKNIYNEKLDIEIFKNADILELSQKLINEPIPDAINEISNLFFNRENNNGYE